MTSSQQPMQGNADDRAIDSASTDPADLILPMMAVCEGAYAHTGRILALALVAMTAVVRQCQAELVVNEEGRARVEAICEQHQASLTRLAQGVELNRSGLAALLQKAVNA